jgi:hypothetical protein
MSTLCSVAGFHIIGDCASVVGPGLGGIPAAPLVEEGASVIDEQADDRLADKAAAQLAQRVAIGALLTICLSGGTSRVSIFRAKWIGSELPLSVNRSHSITQLKGRVGPWPPNGFGVLLSYHPGAGSHCR